MKRIAVPPFFAMLVFTMLFLLVAREESPEKVEKALEVEKPNVVRPARSAAPEAALPQIAGEPDAATHKKTEPTRGPARTGTVELGDRIDRFVSHFESGPADEVLFEVELLGEKFPVALTEFERVPGSAGSGVFFGFVDGEPHSRVSWAFHGDAEVGEIQVHGQDTLKIVPAGDGRKHRVQAWDPLELKRCALCLAEEE